MQFLHLTVFDHLKSNILLQRKETCQNYENKLKKKWEIVTGQPLTYKRKEIKQIKDYIYIKIKE